MSINKLSKTDYLNYLTCPEEFWMSYFQPELLPFLSLDAKHKVEQGKIIDRLTQEWFRDGCVIFDKKIDTDQVSFQFRVEEGNDVAIGDIIVFHGDKKCNIFEVKTFTKQKPEQLNENKAELNNLISTFDFIKLDA